MCIFSGKAEVSKTKIFARAGKDGLQYLAYAMTVKAESELAMILPLPVAKDTKKIDFINLEKYEDFFVELGKGWPPTRGGGNSKGPKDDGKLDVVEVGSFIASYVPSQKDFAKLDEKFVLPAATWDKLPQYKEYGFAVFQLKKGAKTIHPMALSFPRLDAKKIFFPTVHIHDGKVEEKGDFDHTLYCQAVNGESVLEWSESTQPAELFMAKLDKAGGLIDGKEHAYRKVLTGKLKNEDTWL